MDTLIAAALNAQRAVDVEGLEAELVKRFGGEYTRYLGDNESNWSSVASAVDPQVVVFERVTNMWDALIEAEAERRRDFRQPTPTDAAHAFLGVPRGGPSEMTDVERRALAARAVLMLRDSDDPVRRPTLAFRDLGIGLTAEQMPDTILSLERSNKLRKSYTHGVFGKGGSVACMFSMATIIITRRQPDLLGEGQEDRVALAIVRQGDADDVGLPFFRYLVGPNNLPYSIPTCEAPDFEPGTLVLHVGYQAERMGLQNWQREESIYAYAETLLFRPTIPYGIQDARSDAFNRRPAERRAKPETVMGLGQRLEGSGEGLLATSRPATISVPDLGDVRVRWWLFESSDRVRQRAAKGHTVLFTAGGHVHHAWDRQRFTTLVERRRRVAERIIVEVDTEAIPQKQRVLIFSSFRDAMLKKKESLALEQAIADWLGEEPDLDEAETRFTRQALRSTGEGVTAAFRQQLNRAIRTRVPGLVTGGRGRRNGRPPRPKPREDLHAEPTSFTGPEQIEVVPGRRKVFYVQANAVDGFVPDSGKIDISAEETAPDFAYGVGDLRHGRSQISVLAPESATLDTYRVEIALSWLRAAGGYTSLIWPVQVKVVAEMKPPNPQTKSKKDTSRADHGQIAFLWQQPNEDNQWHEKIVGDLQDLRGDQLAELNHEAYGDLKSVEQTIPTIILNERFGELHRYLSATTPRVGDRGVQRRKDRYALAVGVTVANLWIQEDKLKRAHVAWTESGNGREEPPQPMSEEQRQRALVEHARGVIVLLPDYDQLFADEDDPDVVVAGRATTTAPAMVGD